MQYDKYIFKLVRLLQEDSVASWTKSCHHIWPEGMHAPEPSCCDVSRVQTIHANFLSLVLVLQETVVVMQAANNTTAGCRKPSDIKENV